MARVFAVLRLHIFAHVHAALQLVEKFFQLLRGVNRFSASDFLEQGVLQFAAVDNAPDIVVFRNFSQGAAVAEYDERNKVCLFVADFQKVFQRKNVPDVLADGIMESVFGMLTAGTRIPRSRPR